MVGDAIANVSVCLAEPNSHLWYTSNPGSITSNRGIEGVEKSSKKGKASAAPLSCTTAPAAGLSSSDSRALEARFRVAQTLNLAQLHVIEWIELSSD